MSKNNGGPAFPRPQFAPHDVGYQDAGIGNDSQEGMNLRDYFASAALTGLLAGWCDQSRSGGTPVVQAYAMADAMLAEREKPS